MSGARAVKAGGLVYLDGIAGRPDDGRDVFAQTTRILERVHETLTSAGSSIEQVVSVTMYLTAAADFAAMNDAYKAFWSREPPTRTTVVTDLATPGALVEVSAVAVPSGAERTVVHPASWAASPSPYSHAVRTGDTLFLSGLVSRNGRDNTVIRGDVSTQTRAILDSAGDILDAAGMTHANIVSARIYLPEIASFEPMNAAYRAYFPSAPPARATVRAALASTQYDVEIAFVASSAARQVVGDGRPSNPNLSTGIRAGARVYLSGALGNTDANKGDVSAQTHLTLERLGAALAAAGCTPADVVDALIYVTDLSLLPQVDREYAAFFSGHAPARMAVRSGLMSGDALVEIMLTAASA